MNAFVKKEPIVAAGPALVVGASEEEAAPPLSPAGPTISLTGEMAAPIARDYAAGDDFNGEAAFRVVSVDNGNVELELVNLTPSGEPTEDTAESAIDSYLGGKGGGSPDEIV
jgi:hypothetical protein